MGRRSSAFFAAVLAFLLFSANGREIGSYDSQPAKYLAIEIASRHSLSLGHTVGRTPQLGERSAFVRDRQGNFRSAYPLPSALAAGAMAWTLSKVHIIDLDAPLAANLVAKETASALTALMIAFVLSTASRRIRVAQAAIVALAFAAGTNLWASVSQTLWQQETALCALMGAVLLLSERNATLVRALGAGLCLGLAGWARPQLVPAIAVLTTSMVWRWRGRGVAGAIPLGVTAALAMAINISWFGHPLGAVPYLEGLHSAVHGTSRSITRQPWMSAAGLLVSPSRGLLIFSPIIAFAAAGLTAVRREGWTSDLPWCAAAAAAQFLTYSMYEVWWGGHTFGPRYALDTFPMLVPLAAAGFQWITARRLTSGLAVAALAWSICAAAVGAFVYPAEAWNSSPTDVDRDHARLWQWTDSQLARAAQAGWNPNNFALFSRAAFRREPVTTRTP